MELRITLSPEVEQAARKRAAQLGLDVETYVVTAIQDDLSASARLDALLAPLRSEFAASGMTEQQLDELVEQARDEAWRDRRRREIDDPGEARRGLFLSGRTVRPDGRAIEQPGRPAAAAGGRG